jgi:Na+/H+-dicarboxylate symporter
MKPLAQTTKILAGLGAGAAFGLALNALRRTGPGTAQWIDVWLVSGGALDIVGRLFFSAIQMLVVPLVLVSLVCGVAGIGDLRRFGRIGGRVLGLYVATTAAAIALALGLALLIRPGAGAAAAGAAWAPPPAPPLADVIVDLVPRNPIAAMAAGNMLQVIVFALLAGAALALTGTRAAGLRKILEETNEVLLAMVGLVMRAAPVGVFALIARVLAVQGVGIAGRLVVYMATVLGALVLHVLIVYVGLLRGLGRLSPTQFFRKLEPVMAVAFSTSSSNATLPVTLETVEHRMGVSGPVASFALPLGATVNMDGTSIMQGVATVFIAQVYGVALGVQDLILVVLMATLASIGTAGVPGVGLVTLAMVLRQVGLPVEGIGLILGVDRLLDMARTVVNVTGDAVVTVVVARAEGELDLERFDDRGVKARPAAADAGNPVRRD